ncbi:right-handed parallel beta-helix repeat-containing protein [Polaribacter cellanae]|uniref:Right-handed parallel beta-helix repeat-containing protein n=1 Tax=Polaribacter cellanae TaxID=2818493 RepID=A0A975CQT2_9FLAO|nr:right-handed parallel beta-helix repeat-containing protein [Polaribacter cellanae]QTE23928.1 right-handed parallel beta-helix repeat-containing protein [Polaribacter cellanae]
MRYFLTFLICIALISISSCRKDFSTIPSSGNLEFSKDTVFLDTIFTNIGSSTYKLKVYNRGNNAITIPKIKLEKGTSSNYRLNVDGIPGKDFSNIDILAKDSIFVFIETTVNVAKETNPLYTDRILFDNGNNQQDVDLVTLVKDANFIFPERNPTSMKVDNLILDGKQTTVKGRFLEPNELTFSKTKPTVIYGYAAVPANKTLTIEAGARVHFHDNSGLIVDNKATLKVNGTLTEKVIIEGDRLEHSFSEIPGQWGFIFIRPGSVNNLIENTIIKNGVAGILMGDLLGSNKKTKLTIKNSEIYNNAAYGIWARNSEIVAHNLVIGNAGEASLATTLGGTYNFTHSTFANFWNNGIRQNPAVLVNNFQDFKEKDKPETRVLKDLKAANFTNCIFDGNNNFELLFDKVEGSLFNYSVRNSLIKYNPSNENLKKLPEMDFTNSLFYKNIITNGNPVFRNPQKEDFIIGEKSDAINKAISTPFTTDILGVNRSSNPDVGAYQHIKFKEKNP